MKKEEDNSKEIYDKFFNPKGQALKITLKDNSILEGIFVGVTHGDIKMGEPFVIKWHFVSENEIEKYNREILAAEARVEYGSIIKQKDIKSVTFK